MVLDNTGLDGTYDFELRFETHEPAASVEGPSIFEAVQEQLGLRLESKKGAVEFLIVDSVEKPSAN